MTCARPWERISRSPTFACWKNPAGKAADTSESDACSSPSPAVQLVPLDLLWEYSPGNTKDAIMALIVKSTRERVVKLFIVTVLCFGFAAWCQYDAKYKYVGEEKASKRRFNQGAVPVLIVLGIVALFYGIKAARFRIEADEQTGPQVESSSASLPQDSTSDEQNPGA